MQFKLTNNQEISLDIKRKPRLKNNIYLRITPKGVVVSANRQMPLADIEAFVRSKSDWLSKHLRNQEEQKKKRLFVTGNKVYFKGKAFLFFRSHRSCVGVYMRIRCVRDSTSRMRSHRGRWERVKIFALIEEKLNTKEG